MKKHTAKLTLQDLIDAPCIHLGEHISKLSPATIDKINVDYDFPTSYHDGEHFKIIDGKKYIIDIHEKWEYLLSGKSGSFSTKSSNSWYQVKEEIVTAITVYDCLKRFEIYEHSHIELYFGTADEIERGSFTRSYFYFDRGFEVRWPHKNHPKMSPMIIIGKLSQQQTFITAKDILYQYLQLSHYNKEHLNNPAITLQNDPALYLRKNNFFSLLQAFQLNLLQNEVTDSHRKRGSITTRAGNNSEQSYSFQEYINQFQAQPLDYFEHAHFIDHYTTDEHAEAFQQIQEFFHERKSSRKRSLYTMYTIDTEELKRVFKKLVAYRIQMHRPLNFFRNLLEGSSLAIQYSSQLINKSNQVNREALQPIEDFLCSLIDPLNRKFSVRELELNHGYIHTDIRYIESHLAWDGKYPEEMISRS